MCCHRRPHSSHGCTTQNIRLLQEARRCHHLHDAQYFDAPHLALVLSGFSAHPTCGCCGPVCRCARKTSGRRFYFVENGEAALMAKPLAAPTDTTSSSDRTTFCKWRRVRFI